MEKELIKSYNKAIYFYNLLRDEVKNSNKICGIEEVQTLKQYYASFFKQEPYYKYIRHHYALRMMHLIRNIKKSIRILDVGCGYGSEAILWSSIGGKVLGIDLSEDRIAIAKKRVKYFENKLDRNLDIKFSLGNLFSHYGEYDLIWANEAIHHIAPLNEFLNISLKNLKIGGKIIITDQNCLNPYTYILSKRAQKRYGGIYIIKKDLRMKRVIYYAVERIFTLREIKRILTKIFRNVEVYPFSYIPFFIYKAFNNYSMKIERRYVRKLPIIKLFSVGYCYMY